MKKYWWPGHATKLLGELQRQQNNFQFCDTLLQTDAISVPTHSCILAALSPYLSERISASPSPLSGQKHQLRLYNMKGQTLLKLVGLLYSGEMEVNGSEEQSEVLSAACQFGIIDLVDGQNYGGMTEGKAQKKKIENIHLRAGKEATDLSLGKTLSVSTGTQTVEMTLDSSFSPSRENNPPAQQPASPVTQNMDSSIMLQPQNTFDKHLSSTGLPIPSFPSGAPNEGEPTLGWSSNSITHPTTTSTWYRNTVDFPICLSGDVNSQTSEEHSPCMQSSEIQEDRILMGVEDEQTDVMTADKKETRDQPKYSHRDEAVRQETGKSTEKNCAYAGRKNLAKMKQSEQMVETTQISIKVKLVRSKGKVWEVVSMQDADETLSVLTSLKQPDLACKLGTPTPATADLPEPPPSSLPPNTTCDSHVVRVDCSTLNQNEVESALLGQAPGPIEESDEQIEKLLEDIMMGLNILPNLERDCKKSSHIQPSSHDRTSVCHVPIAEKEQLQSETHAGVSTGGCVYYQGHSSADTVQHQPSCSSLLPVQLDSPRGWSSVMSVEQRDATSHKVTLSSEMQKAPTCSVISRLYTACKEQSLQEDKGILGFIPLMKGNSAQSSHSLAVPCIDDLLLPPCLSPVETSFNLAPNHEPVLISMNGNDKIQSQSPVHAHPWLTEKPGSLLCPLSAITVPSVEQGENLSVSHYITTETNSKNRKMIEPLRCEEEASTGESLFSPKRKMRRLCHPRAGATSQLADREGTKNQINLSGCSVSLSSNNVLAQERQMAFRSSNKLESSTITECQRKRTRRVWDLCTDETRIRTPDFLNKIKDNQSNTYREHSSLLKPVVRTARIAPQGRSIPKQKLVHPLNTVLIDDTISEKKGGTSEQQIINILSKEERKGEKKRCGKRRRNKNEGEVIAVKKSLTAAMDDKSDIIPAVGKIDTPTQAQAVNRIRHQHSKTRKPTTESSRDLQSQEKSGDVIKETDKHLTEPQKSDGFSESHTIVKVTVDRNHYQILKELTAEVSKSHRGNTKSSAVEDASVCGDEQQPPFSRDASGEEEANLAAQSEQRPQTPDEAREAGEAGALHPTQSKTTGDEGLSNSDTTTTHSVHKSNPQTPERTGSSLSDTVVFIENSSYGHEEEVDVLLYSPMPLSRVSDNGLGNMDISPDEEEDEEDLNEIDVTGDEAE